MYTNIIHNIVRSLLTFLNYDLYTTKHFSITSENYQLLLYRKYDFECLISVLFKEKKLLMYYLGGIIGWRLHY